jgi:hypothetical protein
MVITNGSAVRKDLSLKMHQFRGSFWAMENTALDSEVEQNIHFLLLPSALILSCVNPFFNHTWHPRDNRIIPVAGAPVSLPNALGSSARYCVLLY